MPQPEDILEDCTLGGAQAVRQRASIGSLEVGKKADLLVVNTQRPHLVPSGRIVSDLDSQRTAVRHRVVDGRRQVCHAQQQGVLTMDEAALVAEADKVGERVWKKVLEASGPIPIPGRR